VNDEALDFALVAVGGDATARAGFGWNPLIEAEGKVVIGEFVTIVQHPGGGLKQIAIRDNRLVDVLDTFLHYEADTEPGSSGSPVFNDQWEIVALHHASVPTDGDRPGFVNEGIRVSRLLAFIRQAGLPPGMQRLRNELFGPERTEIPQRVDVRGRRVPGRTAPLSDSTVVASRSRGWRRPEPARPPASATLTVPLEITVSLGRGTAVDLARDAVAEAVTIDPDYASREGYDGTFLGATDDLLVDLPKLSPAMRARVATIPDERGEGGYVLRYHHYSVVMNRDRRLAYFTAVNIDGTQSRQPKRESDRWFIDPRIPEDDQTGEAVYADNDLDRGHLVRRLDPAWGSDEQAKVANDDTFHFTNCTPQHRDFNQNRTTWAGLENYILENADNRDLRVCVFTGPVLADDDDLYRGVQLPRQFWKVVTMVKRDGTLSATGYLLSQEDLLKGLELDPDFSYGAYRTFQVPISHIEALTGLSIGVAEHDPLLADEAEAATFREIGSREDIVL
jgi:endonuclease G